MKHKVVLIVTMFALVALVTAVFAQTSRTRYGVRPMGRTQVRIRVSDLGTNQSGLNSVSASCSGIGLGHQSQMFYYCAATQPRSAAAIAPDGSWFPANVYVNSEAGQTYYVVYPPVAAFAWQGTWQLEVDGAIVTQQVTAPYFPINVYEIPKDSGNYVLIIAGAQPNERLMGMISAGQSRVFNFAIRTLDLFAMRANALGFAVIDDPTFLSQFVNDEGEVFISVYYENQRQLRGDLIGDYDGDYSDLQTVLESQWVEPPSHTEVVIYPTPNVPPTLVPPTSIPLGANAAILITPESGPIGTMYYVGLNGFAPNEAVQFLMVRDETNEVVLEFSQTVDGTGSVATTISTEPGDALGGYTVYATGQRSGVTVSTLLIIADGPEGVVANPTVTLTPYSGVTGTYHTVQLSGFAQGETVVVDLFAPLTSTTLLQLSATMNSNGEGSTSFYTETGDPYGTYTVTAAGSQSGRYAVGFFELVRNVGSSISCPGSLPPRLIVGSQGRVLPGDPNNVRAAASTSATRVTRIPGGGIFTVVSGPTCAEGYTWWQVTYQGITGWTAEGSSSVYWVEPR